MKNGALTGLRVIDLTHYISGPYCTKLMAGFGAEVIKIERPKTGDGMRSMGPFFDDKPGLEHSIPFLWLNTGKKSAVLNLKTEKGVEILKDLVRGADVLIENFSPRVMPGLGLSYDVLKEINPRLVMTAISNFGQTGPNRDLLMDEISLQAMSGIMYLTGDAARSPLTSGPAICQYTAGQHAYVATLMALFQRNRTGTGQYIDVSIQESALENIEIALATNLQQGKIARRGKHVFVPWDMYECKDGYVPITAMPYRHWHRAAEIFDEPRLFEKKFDLLVDRVKHREEYESLLMPCAKAYAKKDLFLAGQARNLAFGCLENISEAARCEQHREREFFVAVDHPETGTHSYCGAPYKMSRTRWKDFRAPLLGEHDDYVFGTVLGFSSEDRDELTKQEAMG